MVEHIIRCVSQLAVSVLWLIQTVIVDFNEEISSCESAIEGNEGQRKRIENSAAMLAALNTYYKFSMVGAGKACSAIIAGQL